MLDPYLIRKDFPIFNREISGKKIIYFDNAATSQKPRQVIDALVRFYQKYNSNIHRGVYHLSMEASRLYEEAHEIIAKFIGAKGAEEIIFVKNTTEAINLVAYMVSNNIISPGDNIVTTIMEHHSNLIPWFRISSKKNVDVRILNIDGNGRLMIDELEDIIDDKTRLIAVTHVSNVLGYINDVKRIAKIAHRHGAYVLVDGAQSVPHIPINVKDMDIDFLAFSGHKMLGPTGIGVLYVRQEILDELDPPIIGGGAVKEVHLGERGLNIRLHDLPWRFEAGTPNIAGAIGLAEAAKYLMKIGMNNIMQYEEELTQYLLKRLEETGLLNMLRVLGDTSPRDRLGIFSFTLGRMDPHATALLLSEDGIAVRSGYHCAQPLHEKLGFRSGSVRVSLYLYNTLEEIDHFIESLKRILLEVRNT